MSTDDDYLDAGYQQCRACGAWNDGGPVCSARCEHILTEQREWDGAHRCAGSDEDEPHPCRCEGGEDACTRCASCHEQAEQEAEDARAALA
jgi:hypothetical protein